MDEERVAKPERRIIKAVSNRTLGGVLVAVLLIVFISVNRDDTHVSFILFTARTSLWIALTIAGVIGFLAGFLLGRKHAK